MEKIIKSLYENETKFNEEAINEARKNKGKINDYLLVELEKINEDIDNKKLDYTPLFFDYAVFLLAEFQEKRLYPLLMKILNKPELEAFDFFGIGVMDRLPSIVASTFDGNFDLINEIIEDKEVDSFTRERLLNSYIYFYKNKMISTEELEKYIRKLIKIYNYEEDEIYNEIPLIVSNIHLFNMIKDVKELFDKNLVELFINGDYDTFIDDIFNYENDDKITPFEDIVKEMSRWSCFREETKNETDPNKIVNDLEDLVDKEVKESINTYSKVGRNDPCPCGSGKKYKKCCLDKEKYILPYQSYIDKSLNEYPKENTNENEVNFYTFYNKEYIEIDKLLYKAIKFKSIPVFVKRDRVKEKTLDYNYLNKAYELIKEVVSKNNFKTIDEYDKKVSIHYSLYRFFNRYSGLIIERIGIDELYLEKLEELINYFYDNFEIKDESELVFLDRKSALYKLADKYEEGIKFFEEKLKTSKYNRQDIYDFLFYEYENYYDYDEAISKMDTAIENEKDEELKNYLEEIKLDFIDEY